MSLNPDTIVNAPPLRLTWRDESGLTTAIAGNDTLYGVRANGRLVALRSSDGTGRWETTNSYLPGRLVRQDNRLFVFRSGMGLAYLDDRGTSATEVLALSFGATPEANIASPVVDGRWVYLSVNQGMYATHQDQGLQYMHVMEGQQPFSLGLAGTRDIVAVDGRGIPFRYRSGDTGFVLTWQGQAHGIPSAPSERPFVITGNRLIIAIDSYTVAYNLHSGTIAWVLPNVPARSFAVDGTYVYAAFQGAALWAIRPSDGAVAWHRQFLYDLALQGSFGLALAGNHLYFGGVLLTNPDGALLLAVNSADGSFGWLSRSVSLPWAGGIPVAGDDGLYVYGSGHTGAYGSLPSAPQVGAHMVEVSPRPLRGRAADFGPGRLRANLPVAARISAAPYRERQGLGSTAVLRANWGVGTHEATWSVSGGGGFTDVSQFGYMLIDVEETSGLSYSHALLMPVNAFPDIMGHWAQSNIEVMVYHKFVSGYPDQLFRPNNLVTRAESSTIIAKTLGLLGPSPGFRTRFTDIGSHWARDAIMVLEERGIIGGFAEPDGTFTFRPDLNMTRAQQARILVQAYAIPAAPPAFQSRFTDIGGHWAANDIRSLEAAGYVQGFLESDGSYTYRPEQNLTRAEMCAIIVRIRGLTR